MSDTDHVLVGVDAGTTSIKAVAFSLDGTALADAARESPVSAPRPGWVEQDPAATWERTADVIRAVVDALPASATVAAVGVAGQGAGCWLVDEDGDPVRDAILWSDGRTGDYVREWRDGTTYDAVFDRCGYGLFPGLPLPIYRWVEDEEPETVERADTAFFCKDWLKFRLTGERSTDPSDASIAHYLPDQQEFSAETARRLGAERLAALIPDPVDADDVVGRVTPAAADATGLPEGTPVVSGTMDVAASAFGSGVAEPGGYSSVVGTTLQNQTLTAEPAISGPRSGYTLALGVEGMGLRAMGTMAGTPNLDWFVDELFDGTDVSSVEERVRSVPVGAGGVLYHPYLSSGGEKAPFVDPGARAQFTGLTAEHTRDHLARAVYEGVALAMRDCYEHLPGTPDRVHLSGGGARSELWCQLFADCLDAEVAVPAGEEFGAKGAALLAGVGVDLYDDVPSAVGRATAVAETYAPRPDASRRYDRWYDVYRTTRERLTDVWERRREALDGL